MFKYAVFFALILTGCAGVSRGYVAGDQAPEGIRKRLPTVTSRASCASHQGVWQAVSAEPAIFPNGGYCQFRSPDGGQSCHSSRDCAGYCELSFDDPQDEQKPRCSSSLPPRWDRCVPGYYENGKVFGRGECFGGDAEVQ